MSQEGKMPRSNCLNEILAVAARILTELRPTRRALVRWAIFPAARLLLFGLIYAGNGSTGKSFDATAPGILIGAALCFSCLSGLVTTIVAERAPHVATLVALAAACERILFRHRARFFGDSARPNAHR